MDRDKVIVYRGDEITKSTFKNNVHIPNTDEYLY